MKICSKCKEEKDISLFPISGSVCKSCKYEYHKEYSKLNKERLKEYIKEYSKSYRSENKDILKNKSKSYREENSEKIKEHNKNYYNENKDKVSIRLKEYRLINKEEIKQRNDKWRKENKSYFTNYIKERCVNDDLFKLKNRIRALVKNSIKYSGYTKRSKTPEIIGCSFEEFKLYLESKFESWMSWDNYGLYNGELNYGWDIDHIIPLSSALSEDDIIKLNHYTNLQPLCSKTNRDIKRSN